MNKKIERPQKIYVDLKRRIRRVVIVFEFRKGGNDIKEIKTRTKRNHRRKGRDYQQFLIKLNDFFFLVGLFIIICLLETKQSDNIVGKRRCGATI